jgi:hypothetical protein
MNPRRKNRKNKKLGGRKLIKRKWNNNNYKLLESKKVVKTKNKNGFQLKWIHSLVNDLEFKVFKSCLRV